MVTEHLLKDYDVSPDQTTMIRKGYSSLLPFPNDWSLWVGWGTSYGNTYVGPILWMDVEVELKWGSLKWLMEKGNIGARCASVGGQLLGVLQAQNYLGVRIYKHKTLENLYWFSFGFEPSFSSALSAVPVIVPVVIGAVLVGGFLFSVGTVLFGTGYLIRSIRMRPEDLARPPKTGLGETIKQTQYLLLIGIGAWLVWKFVK